MWKYTNVYVTTSERMMAEAMEGVDEGVKVGEKVIKAIKFVDELERTTATHLSVKLNSQDLHHEIQCKKY